MPPPGDPAARRGALSRIGRLGVLTALAVALGYAFSAVPNVKPISLVFFAAGASSGPSGGLLVAVLGMGIYSVANPWGPAPPLVLAAKVAGAVLFAAAGAAVGPRAARARSFASSGAFLAVAGAVVTVAYGLLVDLATAATMGMARDPVPTLVAGVPFNIAHTVSNAALFGLAGPVVLRRLVGRE